METGIFGLHPQHVKNYFQMSASLNNKLRNARTMLQNGDTAGVRALCSRILDQAPRNPEALTLRGIAAMMENSPAVAAPDFRKALEASPADGMLLEYLSLALLHLGEFTQAESYLRQASSIPGAPASVWMRLGLALLHQQRPAEALPHLQRASALAPRDPDVVLALGRGFAAAGNNAEAEQAFKSALELSANHPDALFNLGALRLAANDLAQARNLFEQTLRLVPDNVDAIFNLALISSAQGRYGEAVHHLRAATALDPANAATWAALADNLMQIGELADADAAAVKAGALDPALSGPWSLRAQLQILKGELAAACDLLQQGYEQTSSAPLLGMLAHQLRHMCDWKGWQQAWGKLRPFATSGVNAGTPFALLSEDLTSAEILDYTRSWAQQRFGTAPKAPAKRPHAAGERLRIGYLSSDFQNHPAAYLITEVLELHDRNRFEVFAYSHGPQDEGAMRKRIVSAVEHFIDIAWEPDDLAIERIRNDRIDILIDLKGYTVGDRLNIFAQRPCPVQVTWLGYPGTTGTDFVDYLIADPQIVPPGTETGCSEQVVRMPHCYQPTDRKRIISQPLSRAEYGLPEDALVLCCFNQTFKITPDVFSSWLRILRAVPDSVLWLVDANRWATANLRRAAGQEGITVERLIFAPRVPLGDHLARYRVADIALDTFPYTSHTTASDALWCGCPLVALRGATFPARVSASILVAGNLPDLITDSLVDYERKILELAADRNTLADVRARVAAARENSPLFDTARFTRDLEALYLVMHSGESTSAP